MLTDEQIKALRDGLEPKCVNAHDLCHGGTSAPCPYCEISTYPEPDQIAELCKELLAWRESFPGYARELERTTNAD